MLLFFKWSNIIVFVELVLVLFPKDMPRNYVSGLVQDCSNSNALAIGLHTLKG